jgi:predicted TIM-barrel fold metal-dependent hydrolase
MRTSPSLIFSEIAELSRLKYFTTDEKNELILKKGLLSRIFHINKIIDFHTHLGWNYFLSKPVDLNKECKTKHFFSEKGQKVNLGHYSDFDFNKDLRQKCQIESVRGVISNNGFSGTHTIPNLLREMKRYRVIKSIVLAIDYPTFSKNSDHILDSIDNQDQLIPFASIHPLVKNKEEMLKGFLKKGAKGIKIHPPIQLASPIHKGNYEVYELCKKYNLPILFHTGYSTLSPSILKRYTQAKYYRQVVKDYPENTFIIGHGGGSDTYLEMSEIGRYNENVYIEIGCQPPQNVKLTIDMMGSDRLVYGSDWPYYPMGMQIAKILIATEGHPILRNKILYSNANNLIKRINHNFYNNPEIIKLFD